MLEKVYEVLIIELFKYAKDKLVRIDKRGVKQVPEIDIKDSKITFNIKIDIKTEIEKDAYKEIKKLKDNKELSL